MHVYLAYFAHESIHASWQQRKLRTWSNKSAYGILKRTEAKVYPRHEFIMANPFVLWRAKKNNKI